MFIKSKSILLIRNTNPVTFNKLTMRTTPKGRFRSQKACNRQESRG